MLLLGWEELLASSQWRRLCLLVKVVELGHQEGSGWDSCPNRHTKTYKPTHTRKLVPITGQASSFLEKKKILISNLIQIHSFFPLLSSSVSRANLSCVVATIFSSFAFLSMSVSMANLSCLLATTFSSLRFLSNSFSSPSFNLLKVA